MLKKALFDHLNASDLDLPLLGIPQASSVPLTVLHTCDRVAYQSAIALKLAAVSHQDANRLAQQVMRALTTPQLPVAIATLLDPLPASSTPTPPGRVSFIVSDAAITHWLQALHQLPLPLAPSRMLPEPVIPLLTQPWQLCQALRLSLPLLLQWSQVRCRYWLRSWESNPLPAPPLSPARSQGQRPWGQENLNSSTMTRDRPRCHEGDPHNPADLECLTWSSASPMASHDLLRTLVAAVDTLAFQADDAATYVRQGYAIAAAMYTFEARLPLSLLPTLEPEKQLAIASLLQAVQQVLQLILLTVLGQTPVLTL